MGYVGSKKCSLDCDNINVASNSAIYLKIEMNQLLGIHSRCDLDFFFCPTFELSVIPL